MSSDTSGPQLSRQEINYLQITRSKTGAQYLNSPPDGSLPSHQPPSKSPTYSPQYVYSPPKTTPHVSPNIDLHQGEEVSSTIQILKGLVHRQPAFKSPRPEMQSKFDSPVTSSARTTPPNFHIVSPPEHEKDPNILAFTQRTSTSNSQQPITGNILSGSNQSTPTANNYTPSPNQPKWVRTSSDFPVPFPPRFSPPNITASHPPTSKTDFGSAGSSSSSSSPFVPPLMGIDEWHQSSSFPVPVILEGAEGQGGESNDDNERNEREFRPHAKQSPISLSALLNAAKIGKDLHLPYTEDIVEKRVDVESSERGNDGKLTTSNASHHPKNSNVGGSASNDNNMASVPPIKLNLNANNSNHRNEMSTTAHPNGNRNSGSTNVSSSNLIFERPNIHSGEEQSVLNMNPKPRISNSNGFMSLDDNYQYNHMHGATAHPANPKNPNTQHQSPRLNPQLTNLLNSIGQNKQRNSNNNPNQSDISNGFSTDRSRRITDEEWDRDPLTHPAGTHLVETPFQIALQKEQEEQRLFLEEEQRRLQKTNAQHHLQLQKIHQKLHLFDQEAYLKEREEALQLSQEYKVPSLHPHHFYQDPSSQAHPSNPSYSQMNGNPKPFSTSADTSPDKVELSLAVLESPVESKSPFTQSPPTLNHEHGNHDLSHNNNNDINNNNNNNNSNNNSNHQHQHSDFSNHSHHHNVFTRNSRRINFSAEVYGDNNPMLLDIDDFPGGMDDRKSPYSANTGSGNGEEAGKEAEYNLGKGRQERGGGDSGANGGNDANGVGTSTNGYKNPNNNRNSHNSNNNNNNSNRMDRSETYSLGNDMTHNNLVPYESSTASLTTTPLVAKLNAVRKFRTSMSGSGALPGFHLLQSANSLIYNNPNGTAVPSLSHGPIHNNNSLPYDAHTPLPSSTSMSGSFGSNTPFPPTAPDPPRQNVSSTTMMTDTPLGTSSAPLSAAASSSSFSSTTAVPFPPSNRLANDKKSPMFRRASDGSALSFSSSSTSAAMMTGGGGASSSFSMKPNGLISNHLQRISMTGSLNLSLNPNGYPNNGSNTSPNRGTWITTADPPSMPGSTPWIRSDDASSWIQKQRDDHPQSRITLARPHQSTSPELVRPGTGYQLKWY
eukprot:CAMPEP_0175063918 /NCGR_PEP_ID=MMETSP0052_2-20121109/15032_1 /TAXON_ID=51329 ORGANISM="Polytomella parva, Strain SAG 63-3" /NCGR_SAMPLE_ID=MMETSP0052_2 /ASSEMBLY_ACC=CAM_ASM_000194 /LENGTH=1111 /DNA_ID=CAMNT_0016330187 /DNA_START=146 /DNA_END=3482 /DNA_ORIENTATION=-